ncbi:MAG TPA: hypothetical protein VFN67_13125 [Polyangiales bacterium]|nr:hypothetical protein [Polyangiales bacterium]
MDTDIQLSPDRDKDMFYTIYDTEPTPLYVGKFLDVPAGATVDFAYTYTGGADLTSLQGTLDLDGQRIRYKRKPTPTYFDVVSDEEKARLDKHHSIWDYK